LTNNLRRSIKQKVSLHAVVDQAADDGRLHESALVASERAFLNLNSI
jgi:hypothetical protein